MKFEVNKFLALTALLAGATAVAAGCSSSDSKQAPPGNEAGDAGDSNTPAAGSGNTTSGGAAGTTQVEAGAAGVAGAPGGAAGAAEGGASDGGAAGAPVIGTCISDLVGAAGAADESSPCDALGAAGAPDCGDEGGNYVAQGCRTLYNSGWYRPSVILAFNECGTALANTCDGVAVADCATGLIGKGCTQATTNEACAFVAAKCPGVTPSLCTGIMDLTTVSGQAAISACMDPSAEEYFPYTSGDTLNCDLNLQYCADLPVPALR